MVVERLYREHSDDMDAASAASSSRATSSRQSPAAQFTSPSLPAAGPPPSSGEDSSGGSSTPPKRRQAPPSTISDFPSATDHRIPIPPVLSPSPVHSPARHSLLRPRSRSRSPPHATLGENARANRLALPLHQPQAALTHSPWHALAAASGAPTPSLDGPFGRNSPQLGYPFEQLNLGGSWSGANLTSEPACEETSPSTQIQPASTRSGSVPSGAVSSGGLAPDAILRYRAAIAHGSSSRSRSPLSLSPAMANRKMSLSKSLPLPMAASTITQSPSPLASSSVSVSPIPNHIGPLSATMLPRLVSMTTTLILDVRPPSSFQASHIPTSHSIPIPSTLLRRPGFTLAKLAQMLNHSSQDAVSRWQSMHDIVLVDQDSTSVPEGCVLQGLANKFEREGFAGNIWYLQGGLNAAVEVNVELVTEDTDDQRVGSAIATPGGSLIGQSGVLGVGRLGRLAFQQGSTGGTGPGTKRSVTFPATPGTPHGDPFNSLALTERLGRTINQPVHSRSAEPSFRHKLQPANPFFDNIRQNLELSHGGITERIPLSLATETIRRADELPPFLRDLVTMSERDSMERLAQQFYQIELSEQKRLQSVMDFHANGSGAVITADHSLDEDAWYMQTNEEDKHGYFPFSITAGVERGTKNRYKNIWPYDFSRVKLGNLADDYSDYINASFVQPRGTTRRYIATQGPLDATYRDFWTLVWEQDVNVIVMLTKQFEGGLMKCGNYWQEEVYGGLHLRLISHVGGEDKVERTTTAFDFGVPSPGGNGSDKSNIKRVFNLWHDSERDRPPRQVVQIQCVTWPDFDVPDSPDVLLDLIKDVDCAVDEMRLSTARSQGLRVDEDDRRDLPPVLVHCSAGVGRTGSFILVDALAEALRREYKAGNAANIVPKPLSSIVPVLAVPVLPKGQAGLSMDKTQIESPRDNFSIHRGTSESDDWSRPSMSSGRPSDESITSVNDHDSLGAIRSVTKSNARHRTPSPLSSMTEPVVEVLEGMRAQRMSLVQSLRQYLFVHRAIIQHYLRMIDEEAGHGGGAEFHGPDRAPSSITSADDESHIKRKPSPTELQAAVWLARDEDQGANLAKRPSFKKMRAGNRG